MYIQFVLLGALVASAEIGFRRFHRLNITRVSNTGKRVQRFDAGLNETVMKFLKTIPMSPVDCITEKPDNDFNVRSNMISEPNKTQSDIPDIFFISQDHFKEVGDNTQLHCAVTNHNNSPVLWFHYPSESSNPPRQITSTRKIIYPDARYKLFVNSSYSSYTIDINNLHPNDSGTYQCEVIYGLNKKITADVNLQVNNPKIHFITPLQRRKVGQPTFIECSIVSSLSNPLLWVQYNFKHQYIASYLSEKAKKVYQQRVMVMYDNDTLTHTLQFKKVALLDAGYYECILLTHSGQKIFSQTELIVED